MSDITPGIWTVYEEGAEDGAQVWAREDGPTPARRRVASHIGDADARLIAAAPELLVACQAAIGAIQYLLANDDNGPAEYCIEDLASAINKAEGRIR